MSTTWPISDQWTDNESITAAKMYARIDSRMNDLAAATVPTVIVVTNSTTTTLANNTEKLFTVWSAGALLNVGDLTFASGIITIGTAGIYRWDAEVVYGSAATQIETYVKLNGTTVTWGQDGRQGSAAHQTQVSTGGVIGQALNSGDQLELAAIALDAAIPGATTNRSFSVTRLA